MGKTDLKKYRKFLDEMNIRYEVKHYKGGYYLSIHHSHINYIYGNAVEIEFDENEKFIHFNAWGE